MPRPPKSRHVCGDFPAKLFKPAGIPAKELEILVIGLDELEAIRLVDGQGLYQEAAAEQMGVSRATLGRILENGRRKVALALCQGKALGIEDGERGNLAPTGDA